MADGQFLAAVWHSARDVRLELVARAVLKPGEVRIKVAKCGICGSDMHEYVDGPHAIPVGQPHEISRQTAPIIIGHEFCGTVIEVGSDVRRVRVGQRVAIEPAYRCGQCPACRRGEYNLCISMGFAGLMGDGGMAEEAIVPEYMVHALPDNVGFDQAAVLEPAAVALHAVRRSRLAVGESCAVVGAGPIGLLLVKLAKIAGARQIAVSDVSDERLSYAARMGATRTVNSSREKMDEIVCDVEVAFEAVGLQRALNDACAVVRKGGRLVLVGLFGTPPAIDAFGLVNREIDLLTSVGYRHVFPDLIAMVAEGIFNPAEIVTREVPLTSVVDEGFERLTREARDVKVLVSPG
jgi:(R,R)-butanediol dehydrogenase/meso-butanediol dehydrogenase/diacetyl reductase